MRYWLSTKKLLLLLFMPVYATAQPPARWQAQIAYDEANKQLLIYGGAGAGDTIFSDTWALRENKWRKLSDTGPATIKCAFAYDAHRKRAVLFGGSGNKPQLDETWEWDGIRWKQINIPGPSARNHPMAVYDPVRQHIVLFGGINEKGLLTDTWIYDGKSWQQKDDHGPAGCIPHGMLFDKASGQVILVSLSSKPDSSDAHHLRDDVWAWTGDHWKKISAGPVYTSLQGLQGVATNVNGGILLFDGDNVTNGHGITLIFNNHNWQAHMIPDPSPRVGESMIYDPQRHRTILFGGSNRKEVYNDVWEWDGRSWKIVKTAND